MRISPIVFSGDRVYAIRPGHRTVLTCTVTSAIKGGGPVTVISNGMTYSFHAHQIFLDAKEAILALTKY